MRSASIISSVTLKDSNVCILAKTRKVFVQKGSQKQFVSNISICEADSNGQKIGHDW